MSFSGEQRGILLGVARTAIRALLADQKPPPPAECAAHPELNHPAGCFVSLHEMRTHRLRGCVGRIESTASLLVTVHESAINVLEDPRFRTIPVRIGDLPQLELELTVLSPLVVAAGCLDFEPQTQGIYLTVAGRSACFLPQVARETGWDRDQLLQRLCSEKLGLSSDAWRQPGATLRTFTAEIIGPEAFE
jgi:AmmeMemoRadiSam system protein A